MFVPRVSVEKYAHFPQFHALILIPVQFNIPLMCTLYSVHTIVRSLAPDRDTKWNETPEWKFIVYFYLGWVASKYASNESCGILYGKFVVNRHSHNHLSSQLTHMHMHSIYFSEAKFPFATIALSCVRVQSMAKLQLILFKYGFLSAIQRLIYGLFE